MNDRIVLGEMVEKGEMLDSFLIPSEREQEKNEKSFRREKKPSLFWQSMLISLLPSIYEESREGGITSNHLLSFKYLVR